MGRIEKDRFVRFDEINYPFPGGKLRNWRDTFQPNSTGEFLSRIWSLYGPPLEIMYEGFSYLFHDTDTGLHIHVYSGASGPAYGGTHEQADLYNAIYDDFDRLLESAPLADCEVEFETDFGVTRVGARNGVPFEEEVTRKPGA